MHQRFSPFLMASLLGSFFPGAGRADDALPPDANTQCPVMTKKKVKPTLYVDYEGHRIFVCCKKCVRKFPEDPKKYLANLPPLDKLPKSPGVVPAVVKGSDKSSAPLPPPPYEIRNRDDAVTVTDPDRREVLRYVRTKPKDSPLSVESAGYFHPLTTPAGVAVTDVAPDDHRHHRGIFLAWVEMHGRKDADFWGWGEHAPKENRKIVNRSAQPVDAGFQTASFRIRNAWEAEGDPLVLEDLTASVRQVGKARVLDLEYSLTADADLTLSRWAFSGFCLRTRKDGEATAAGPEGPVNLPAPNHMDPASDWPAAAWYGYDLKLPDGKTVGAAVIDHPKNPPSLWHNVVGIRMLNPCIVAPGEVKLKANEPLVLRYRVVAVDGALDAKSMNTLAEEFRNPTAR